MNALDKTGNDCNLEDPPFWDVIHEYFGDKKGLGNIEFGADLSVNELPMQDTLDALNSDSSGEDYRSKEDEYMSSHNDQMVTFIYIYIIKTNKAIFWNKQESKQHLRQLRLSFPSSARKTRERRLIFLERRAV